MGCVEVSPRPANSNELRALLHRNLDLALDQFYDERGRLAMELGVLLTVPVSSLDEPE